MTVDWGLLALWVALILAAMKLAGCAQPERCQRLLNTVSGRVYDVCEYRDCRSLETGRSVDCREAGIPR